MLNITFIFEFLSAFIAFIYPNCRIIYVYRNTEKTKNTSAILRTKGTLQLAGVLFMVMTIGLSTDKAFSSEQEETSLFPPNKHVRIYLNMADNNYQDIKLHVWNTKHCNNYRGVDTLWTKGLVYSGIDKKFGAYWDLPIVDKNQGCIHFIPHRDNEKLLPQDGTVDISKAARIGYRAFTFEQNGQIYYEPHEVAPLHIKGAAAHWINVSHLLMPPEVASVDFYHSATGQLAIKGQEVINFDQRFSASSPQQMSWTALFPHLSGMTQWTLPFSNEKAKEIVKNQLLVAAKDEAGQTLFITQVQIAALLDDLYVHKGTADDSYLHYGAVIKGDKTSFRLWAPTAQAVSLVHYDKNKQEQAQLPMAFDSQSGSWFITSDQLRQGDFYRYKMEVYHPSANQIRQYEVTDPYSLSLAEDSNYSQVVDLNSKELKPAGWDNLTSPHAQDNPTKMVIYEAHVRDLSALDKSISKAHRGKFIALTKANSPPVKHLKSLSESGVTHLHLLPVFDIASINENPTKLINITDTFFHWSEIDPALAKGEFAPYRKTNMTIAEVLADIKNQDRPDNPKVQQVTQMLAPIDSFNWGYDPYHYTVPEGSYATDADGMARIKEFRAMVTSIKKEIGMNVIMDVVYNHTYAVGPDDKQSVLDKVVPWYYHRLNPVTGGVETSTCCANTAPENAMMARLIRDSLVVWVRDYKIDAFRFDLMGHHPKAQILDSLAAVHTINPDVYFYGEGWNFGEVANQARFEQAIQPNMAGTGIGTFSDRLRDAVRGGEPFDNQEALRANQGFGNGAYVMPNEMNAVDKGLALHYADIVRLGMAGNLKAFRFITQTGELKRGDQIDYNGQPAGYALDPSEVQNYVSKHDNQTLWDNDQYKTPYHIPITTRVRMQAVSLATAMLGQGVPFTQQGVELLRSKSMDRDSYDSGDWFNWVDYDLQDNNWDKGLPPEGKNASNFGIIAKVIEEHGDKAKPRPVDIRNMLSYYKELASLRAAYPLLTLGRGDEVIKRVGFLNTGPHQIPSLILMTIDNGIHSGKDLDPRLDALMVIINATPFEHYFDTHIEGLSISEMHKTNLKAHASIEDTVVIIPAWTPLVLEQKRQGARGVGIAIEEDEQ